MTSRSATFALATLLFAACGCGNRGQSPSSANSEANATSASSAVSTGSSGAPSQASAADQAAIRAAIEHHLRSNSGLNLDAMAMVVDSVVVQGDQAQAHASFQIKSGGTTGMTMQYLLQRSGSGWVVTNGQPADGNTQLPPSTHAQPGASTTQSTPSMPDVDAFFKDHPAPKSN